MAKQSKKFKARIKRVIQRKKKLKTKWAIGKYLCNRCGSTDNLTVHHKIPRCEGGSSHPKNLEVLCYTCHWNHHHPNAKIELK